MPYIELPLADLADQTPPADAPNSSIWRRVPALEQHSLTSQITTCPTGLPVQYCSPAGPNWSIIKYKCFDRGWHWLCFVSGQPGERRRPTPQQGIVNTPNYAPGPFAPGSIVTIFGTGLARPPQA